MYHYDTWKLRSGQNTQQKVTYSTSNQLYYRGILTGYCINRSWNTHMWRTHITLNHFVIYMQCDSNMSTSKLNNLCGNDFAESYICLTTEFYITTEGSRKLNAECNIPHSKINLFPSLIMVSGCIASLTYDSWFYTRKCIQWLGQRWSKQKTVLKN